MLSILMIRHCPILLRKVTTFKCSNKKKIISERELKYFPYSFKNASCLGKMHLLPKIYKKLYNVPGCPVISNCRTPAEKVSEFLDHLQPVMKSRK